MFFSCHPVIILKAHSDRAIITPVTAFGSGAENDFQPPWQHVYHRLKSLFPAFSGARRPKRNQAALRPADSNMQMPKPQASSVYLRHFWTLLVSVLGRFNRTIGLLHVAKDSLAQLRQLIKQKCDSHLRDALVRLGASTATALAPMFKDSPTVAPPPVAGPQSTGMRSVMTYSRIASGISGSPVTQVVGTAGDCGDRQIKKRELCTGHLITCTEYDQLDAPIKSRKKRSRSQAITSAPTLPHAGMICTASG